MVEFSNGLSIQYEAKSDLASELGVTIVLVKYWLHKKSATYVNYNIKSIYYI